ncbi:MAG: pyridoxal-phosphate dependent enzyme [Pseudomonadota bacterium]|jgi:threonine dehydratase|nr:pyridoxal-phosphate dependent enzyme [Pseudomonadota bacterium]
MPELPTFSDIQAASVRIAERAIRTPTITSAAIDRQLDASLSFKCENLQHAGAFKFRGAWNAMSQLSAHDRQMGAITHSSGNHAQALALCGRLLGISTVVVMPHNAPQIKKAATVAHGAKIIDYDPAQHRREDISAEHVRRHGFTLIPPYDHPDVIAGQGTAALEMLEDGGPLDLLLVPCGGGGLLSGSALSAKHLVPDCRVIGVEPVLADDAARSFHSGQLQRVDNPNTIADGTRTESLGQITFPLIQKYVDDIVTVSEEAIKQAVMAMFHLGKLVVEPSGALGLAALLSGAVVPRGRVGIVLSGGNVDDQLMIELMDSNRP